MKLDAHLFVCTNTRGPAADGSTRESCGAKDAEALRSSVKSQVVRKFPGKKIRVNAAGCLGLCEEGIVAVCYGSKGGNWQTDLINTPEDAEKLFSLIEKSLSN